MTESGMAGWQEGWLAIVRIDKEMLERESCCVRHGGRCWSSLVVMWCRRHGRQAIVEWHLNEKRQEGRWLERHGLAIHEEEQAIVGKVRLGYKWLLGYSVRQGRHSLSMQVVLVEVVVLEQLVEVEVQVVEWVLMEVVV